METRAENIQQSDSLMHSENLVNITSKQVGDNITELYIELNEQELIKKTKEGVLRTDKQEKTLEDITGIYGRESYSPNKEYCVSYCDGHYEGNKWKNGDIALVKDKTLLFKKKIQRPNDCFVSNNGIVICCDWQNSDALTGRLLIFDIKGEQLFAKKTTANLGMCAISDNSEIALFETYNSDTNDSDSIFIIDVKQQNIIHRFTRPTSFNKAIIDTDKRHIKLIDYRGFIYEIDFEGNQTNNNDYEKQIMTNGSIHDRLSLYSSKPDELKLNDARYLELLTESLTDKDVLYTFGQDKIQRMIGEFYEANDDSVKAIEHWEIALQLNPKIGLKRRLEAIRKKV
jgi:hypothetical protein